MHKIGSQAFEALAQDYGSRLPERLEAFVRDQHPDIAVYYLSGGLDRFVAHLIAVAQSFGIVDAPGIFAFADLACFLGVGFPGRPKDQWAQATLMNTDLVGAEKVEACWRQLDAADDILDRRPVRRPADLRGLPELD